jgi:hypothetical protein
MFSNKLNIGTMENIVFPVSLAKYFIHQDERSYSV